MLNLSPQHLNGQDQLARQGLAPHGKPRSSAWRQVAEGRPGLALTEKQSQAWRQTFSQTNAGAKQQGKAWHQIAKEGLAPYSKARPGPRKQRKDSVLPIYLMACLALLC